MAYEQGKPWKAQFNRQVMLIHVAAFFLHLRNFNSDITPHSQDQIDEILEQYIPKHDEKALQQFYEF
jgi:hypothetical protein